MNTRIMKIKKGIRKYMEEKVKVYSNILTSAQNRLVLGIVITGLGVGLIISAYIRPINY